MPRAVCINLCNISIPNYLGISVLVCDINNYLAVICCAIAKMSFAFHGINFIQKSFRI